MLSTQVSPSPSRDQAGRRGPIADNCDSCNRRVTRDFSRFRLVTRGAVPSGRLAGIPSPGERTGDYRRRPLLHHRWSPVACYRPVDSRGPSYRARRNIDGVAPRGTPRQGNSTGASRPSGGTGCESCFRGTWFAAVVGADRRPTPRAVAGPGGRAELAGNTRRRSVVWYSRFRDKPNKKMTTRTVSDLEGSRLRSDRQVRRSRRA